MLDKFKIYNFRAIIFLKLNLDFMYLKIKKKVLKNWVKIKYVLQLKMNI